LGSSKDLIPEVPTGTPSKKLNMTTEAIEEQPEGKVEYSDFIMQTEDQGKIQSFFANKWSDWVFKLRYVAIVLGVVISGVNSYLATQLETTNKPDAVLKDTNRIQMAIDWAAYELYRDLSIDIDIYWGVEPKLWEDPTQTPWYRQEKGQIVLD
jgi:hypothetical protein